MLYRSSEHVCDSFSGTNRLDIGGYDRHMLRSITLINKHVTDVDHTELIFGVRSLHLANFLSHQLNRLHDLGDRDRIAIVQAFRETFFARRQRHTDIRLMNVLRYLIDVCLTIDAIRAMYMSRRTSVVGVLVET